MAETKKVAAKPAAKAAEKKVEEVKVEAVKAEAPAKKETAKKAAAKKAPAKKETAAKKETTKKAPAKKAAVKEVVNVQFAGKSYTTEELVKIAKDVWKYDLGMKEADFKAVELYVKPEESLAYYVINGDVTGSFAI